VKKMQVHDAVTGRFLPGRSGNPAGRMSRTEKRARVTAQVEAWVAELGGRVGTAERIMLQRAAELSMLHPRRNEDATRTANTIAKLLAQAGFHRHRKRRQERSMVAQLGEGEHGDDPIG
jgi:hypothetical protein